MNVSEQIIAVLDELCEKFGFVIDWSKDNIIPYVKELCSRFVRYEVITSVIWVVIGIGCLIGCVITIKQFINTYKKAKSGESSILWDGYKYSKPDTTIFGITVAVFSAAFSLMGILILIVEVIDIIEVICLPEIVFIEYIKSLI